MAGEPLSASYGYLRPLFLPFRFPSFLPSFTIHPFPFPRSSPFRDPPPTDDDDDEMAMSVPLLGVEHLKENGSGARAAGKKRTDKRKRECTFFFFSSSSDQVYVALTDGEVVF